MEHLNAEKEIFGLTFVGNEDDILEPFIRHNIAFVDRLFVVVDEKSVDNSRMILEKLTLEGLPITSLETSVTTIDFRNEFVQSHKAWAYLFLDDDEFIIGVEPKTLRNFIFNLNHPEHIAIPWKTFVINPYDYDISDPPKSLQYAKTVEDYQHYKAIYIRADSEVPHLITAGAHRVSGIRPMIIQGIYLAHYPVRSHKQIIIKYVASQLYYSVSLKNQLPKNHGWHLQEGFSRVTTVDFSNLENLFIESMGYGNPEIQKHFSISALERCVVDYAYQRTIQLEDQPLLETLLKILRVVLRCG
jgi:hypothetical protein